MHFLYISNPLFFVFILSPWRHFGITSLKFLAEVSRSPFQTECHKCSTLSGNTFSAHYVGALPSPIRDVAILPSDVMSPGAPLPSPIPCVNPLPRSESRPNFHEWCRQALRTFLSHLRSLAPKSNACQLFYFRTVYWYFFLLALFSALFISPLSRGIGK